MREIASEFRKQRLSLLDNLDRDGIVITKRGKPFARLVPILGDCRSRADERSWLSSFPSFCLLRPSSPHSVVNVKKDECVGALLSFVILHATLAMRAYGGRVAVAKAKRADAGFRGGTARCLAALLIASRKRSTAIDGGTSEADEGGRWTR
jgi:antitoxin (DNA-binding transcriptional repressor) of toxin-antitoxin stability system